MKGKHRKEKKIKSSLTNCNDSRPSKRRLGSSSTQCEHESPPGQSALASLAVKVRGKVEKLVVPGQLARIWWIPDSEHALHPAGSVGDRPTMHEGVETGSSTIGANATLAHAAKGESGNVQSCVVEGNPAGARRRKDWKVGGQ
jgi:hypothetical protein